jgi:PST family polysaccharide transporter
VNFKQIAKRNKTILTNFSYLSILQLFTILAPLITYPYLLRIVGIELFGVVVFAQTIAAYIALIINFGFNLSASRAVAVNKEDKQALSEIVSSVYISKLVIWLVCLIVYMIIIRWIPFFKAHYGIYLFSFFITFNELLFPVWFFQGIEKMKYTTIINIIVRSLFVVAIFIIVQSKADYLYVPALNAIGALLGGIIGTYVLFKHEHIYFMLVPVKKIVLHFKESVPLFVSIVSVKVYMYLNKLLIGIFLGMSEVAIYDLGEKISNVLKTPIEIIRQAVFPKISREKDISFINKIMFIVAGITCMGYIGIFICSKWIALFFMGEYVENAVAIIRILSCTAILFAIHTFMSNCRLIPFGYDKVLMKLNITYVTFYLCSVGALWVLQAVNLYSLAAVILGVEVFACLLLIYTCNKYHLLKIIYNKQPYEG